MNEICQQIANPIGIIGVALILLAYLLINTGRLSHFTYTFQALNCVGSAMLLFSLMYFWNLASVIIQVAWIAISILGFVRIYLARNKM